MRWNSKYYILERFNKLRAQNNDIVNRHVRASSMIISLEIQQMREVVALLTPLEVTTKELCGELTQQQAKICPLCFVLQTK
jgi:hypothetical protein